MTKVEQYEAIRRDRRLSNLSIRELASKHRMHRRDVRKALESAVPAPRKVPDRVEVAFGSWRAIVKEWLTADLTAPRKQRHTARRVWQRLIDEHGASVSEPTVRRAVADIRAEINRNVAKVPIVQQHALGGEAEVDFGEVVAIIDEVETKLNLFVMRLSASAKAFHCLSRTCDSVAFLDGHVKAFAHFGGVPGRIRYDNLKPAVIDVLIGRERNENQRFVALRGHYGFDSFFCLPGIDGAHEKGGVEGEVGRFRRRWFTPVPVAGSVSELNKRVRDADTVEDTRHVDGRTNTIGEDFAQEKPFLGLLNVEDFETGMPTTARVDAKARISLNNCKYSVPVQLVGRRVEALVCSDVVVISFAGTVVATHERITARLSESLHLDHYLETLQAKPGAVAGATALTQAREKGTFTKTHQQFWDHARRKLGDKQGTKALIDVLLLHRTMTMDEVNAGMRCVLDMDNVDPALVAIEGRRSSDKQRALHTLNADGQMVDGQLASVTTLPPGAACLERPAQEKLHAYDELLAVSK